MILYTNKAPLIMGGAPAIDGAKFGVTIPEEDILPVGHVFKVLFIDQYSVYLTSKDYDFTVTAEMLNTMFIETDVEV